MRIHMIVFERVERKECKDCRQSNQVPSTKDEPIKKRLHLDGQTEFLPQTCDEKCQIELGK